jgi:hypothetical protein
MKEKIKMVSKNLFVNFMQKKLAADKKSIRFNMEKIIETMF